MAVIRYDGRAPRISPSNTNIVRTQVLPQAPVPARVPRATGPTAPNPSDYFGGTVATDTDGFGNITLDTAEAARIAAGASRYKADLDAKIQAAKLASDAAIAAAEARATAEAGARQRLGTGAQAAALQALLAKTSGAGSYREGADTLLGLLSGYETTAKQGITDARTAAERLLGEQYGRASGLLFGGTGPTAPTGAYPALTAYLQANAPTAFQTAPTGPAPTVQNALAAYMAGQGVGTGGVEQEVAAENAALQAAQGNYTGLLDILARQERAGQTSRLNEAQQAATVARTGLEGQRAAQAGAITRQEQAALQELAGNLLGQRMGIETGAEQRKQTLQDALTALLGTGYNVTGDQIAEALKEGTVPAAAPSEQAKNRTATTDWQKLVAQKHPNFTGTWNQAKKKFPKLYKQYLDSKKKD